MKRFIVTVVALFILLSTTAAACTSNIAWTAGTPLSPCTGPSFNPGYLGAYDVLWNTTVVGTPDGYTDTSGNWNADTWATPSVGEMIQYGGYQYKVESVNVGSHTLKVQFIQNC